MIAGAAMSALPTNLGIIGDKCSSYPNSLEHAALLPQNLDTIHTYQIRIEDKSCAHDIVWEDSFHARIRLESAPPGLQLCVLMRPFQSERNCDKTYYELVGTSGLNDTQDVTIWVFWHPQAKPISGSYRLVVSGI